MPSYVPSPHPYSCEVPPLSPSPHGQSPLHPASAQPLLDLAPASGLHTRLHIRSHTDQVTPSLRPLHSSLLPSVSFKRAPKTIHGLATLSPKLDTHSHTWLCHFQNVLLLGRQNISHPPGEPNPCGVMSFSKQDFLFANSLSWGPHPKENYLLLTLTPRHSQDPSELGRPPKLSQLLWPVLSVLLTRKKRPSLTGRFGSNLCFLGIHGVPLYRPPRGHSEDGSAHPF